MNRTRAALAFLATLVSATAIILTTIGGSVLFALEGLLQILTLGQATGVLSDYPLGRGVLVLYACGIALGAIASRWPVSAAIAILPVGACAFLFGGPVAQVYGIVIACTGGLILATGPRPAKA